MSPKRIQLRRTKGWRKPEGAVVVSRPSRWGNPWAVGESVTSRHDAVLAFRTHLDARRRPWPGWSDLIGYPDDEEIRSELAGKDLACWCPLGQPCHADVLLELANANQPEGNTP